MEKSDNFDVLVHIYTQHEKTYVDNSALFTLSMYPHYILKTTGVKYFKWQLHIVHYKPFYMTFEFVMSSFITGLFPVLLQQQQQQCVSSGGGLGAEIVKQMWGSELPWIHLHGAAAPPHTADWKHRYSVRTGSRLGLVDLPDRREGKKEGGSRQEGEASATCGAGSRGGWALDRAEDPALKTLSHVGGRGGGDGLNPGNIDAS